MNRLTDVVRHLLIINVIVYLGTMALDIRAILAAFYPASPFFRPYQIVTHMFMHADFRHLLFNMLMLFFLGPLVEARWGPKRFLAFYLIAFILPAAYYLQIQRREHTSNEWVVSLRNHRCRSRLRVAPPRTWS